MSEMKKAWLLLQDGTLLTGRNFGASGTVMGEVVFSTSMTGYQEALTDPNYYGQIMIQTFPMMGNYGVNSEDFSGKAFMKGCIVREWCDTPSNFRMEGDINTFLKEQNIVGLCDLDTRSLTAKLRDKGTMNGMITTEEITDIDAALKALAEYKIEGAVNAVTTAAVTSEPAAQPENSGGKKVAVMNFGSTVSAVRELVNRGCDVTLHTACEGIEAFEGVQGVLLSEGPGDPVENTEAIALIKALIEKKVPLFGIGLGHQLLALAMGAKTEKLHHGHRGASQPVIDLRTGKTYPTTQNHGYVVTGLDENVGTVSHRNVNDRSVEGIRYTAAPALSVQFRPYGPGEGQDTGYLFDEFLSLIG